MPQTQTFESIDVYCRLCLRCCMIMIMVKVILPWNNLMMM